MLHGPKRKGDSKARAVASIEVAAIITGFETRLDAMSSATRYLVSPDGSFCQRWDLLIIVLLIFTATVTPYEVAFVTTRLDGLFVINRCVDFVFLVDILINFCLIFKDGSGKFVKDWGVIVQTYIRGWFSIDLISILPFDSAKFMTNDEGNDTRLAFRLLRLCRLLKLLRIIRALRIFRRWEIRIGTQHSTMMVLKLVTNLLLANHWLACCWGLTAILQHKDTSTWLTAWLEGQVTTLPECIYIDNGGESIVLNAAHRQGCWAHADIYMACLHWAMMTITSIGYGDIVPSNSTEYAACAAFMLFAGVSWAQIIGQICGIAAQGDPIEITYHRKLDDMNRLMRNLNLDTTLCQAVREFVSRSRSSMRALQRRDVLRTLTGSLAGEVACEGPKFISQKMIRWLNRPAGGLSSGLHAKIVTSMDSETTAPIECIPPTNRLCVLRNGTVCLNAEPPNREVGRFYMKCAPILSIIMANSKNTTWNTDAMLHYSQLRDNTTARTLSYVDVDSLSIDTLHEILALFPEDQAIFRRNVGWLAMFKGMMYLIASGGILPSGVGLLGEEEICAVDGGSENADQVQAFGSPRSPPFQARALSAGRQTTGVGALEAQVAANQADTKSDFKRIEKRLSNMDTKMSSIMDSLAILTGIPRSAAGDVGSAAGDVGGASGDVGGVIQGPGIEIARLGTVQGPPTGEEK
jgi:hypothetical protein